MESTELQSTEAKAAAFQRCILGLRARDGQPKGLSARQQTSTGHWARHWEHSGTMILNHCCLTISNNMLFSKESQNMSVKNAAKEGWALYQGYRKLPHLGVPECFPEG